MDKLHSFQKSLKTGKRYENQFNELFKDKVEQLDGYASDFKITKNGKLVELKTDLYCPTKTNNLFMEFYSYGEEPGGPFQALKKGSDYYIYWFPKSMEFFVFKTATLVKKLNDLYPDPYLINVYNTSHVTRGMKVPREALESIRLDIMEVL